MPTELAAAAVAGAADAGDASEEPSAEIEADAVSWTRKLRVGCRSGVCVINDAHEIVSFWQISPGLSDSLTLKLALHQRQTNLLDAFN